MIMLLLNKYRMSFAVLPDEIIKNIIEKNIQISSVCKRFHNILYKKKMETLEQTSFRIYAEIKLITYKCICDNTKIQCNCCLCDLYIEGDINYTRPLYGQKSEYECYDDYSGYCKTRSRIDQRIIKLNAKLFLVVSSLTKLELF